MSNYSEKNNLVRLTWTPPAEDEKQSGVLRVIDAVPNPTPAYGAAGPSRIHPPAYGEEPQRSDSHQGGFHWFHRSSSKHDSSSEHPNQDLGDLYRFARHLCYPIEAGSPDDPYNDCLADLERIPVSERALLCQALDMFHIELPMDRVHFLHDLAHSSKVYRDHVTDQATMGIPVGEWVGHRCAKMPRPGKALIDHPHMRPVAASLARYYTPYLGVGGRRRLMCTLMRTPAKHHADIMDLAARFSGPGAPDDLRMYAAHALADIPQEQREDPVLLATILYPSAAEPRIDSLATFVELNVRNIDSTYVQNCRNAATSAGCPDTRLPLQVVIALWKSHRHERVSNDLTNWDHHVYYTPARLFETDALAEFWANVRDYEACMALLNVFASVNADERVEFVNVCVPLRGLMGYPKLVKGVANEPLVLRYVRAQELLATYGGHQPAAPAPEQREKRDEKWF